MEAFIFPGQGSQAVGMGQALAQAWPAAAEIFQRVDEALGESLSTIMWEGDGETLTLTRNAQPALMAVSVAVASVLKAEGFDIFARGKFVAGHSLGEYSALVVAGALSLEDGARLLRLRGDAMQQACAPGEGAMAALLGLDYENVVAVVEATRGVCVIANDNAVGQIVISGAAEAVGEAIVLAKEQGAKKAIMLDVSAPFHCPLMQPAADAMRQALADIEIKTPQLPLVENMIAAAVRDPEEIRKLLVQQIVGCVRWRESINFMVGEDVRHFYEIGSGKVLTGMIKRINREASGQAVGTEDEIKKLL